jgi:hypothetical protein
MRETSSWYGCERILQKKGKNRTYKKALFRQTNNFQKREIKMSPHG